MMQPFSARPRSSLFFFSVPCIHRACKLAKTSSNRGLSQLYSWNLPPVLGLIDVNCCCSWYWG